MTESLSPLMKDKIKFSLLETWYIFKEDLLKERTEISQDDIVDIIMDLDYLEVAERDRKVVAEFRKLSFEEQEEIIREAFTEDFCKRKKIKKTWGTIDYI